MNEEIAKIKQVFLAFADVMTKEFSEFQKQVNNTQATISDKIVALQHETFKKQSSDNSIKQVQQRINHLEEVLRFSNYDLIRKQLNKILLYKQAQKTSIQSFKDQIASIQKKVDELKEYKINGLEKEIIELKKLHLNSIQKLFKKFQFQDPIKQDNKIEFNMVMANQITLEKKFKQIEQTILQFDNKIDKVKKHPGYFQQQAKFNMQLQKNLESMQKQINKIQKQNELVLLNFKRISDEIVKRGLEEYDILKIEFEKHLKLKNQEFLQQFKYARLQHKSQLQKIVVYLLQSQKSIKLQLDNKFTKTLCQLQFLKRQLQRIQMINFKQDPIITSNLNQKITKIMQAHQQRQQQLSKAIFSICNTLDIKCPLY